MISKHPVYIHHYETFILHCHCELSHVFCPQGGSRCLVSHVNHLQLPQSHLSPKCSTTVLPRFYQFASVSLRISKSIQNRMRYKQTIYKIIDTTIIHFISCIRPIQTGSPSCIFYYILYYILFYGLVEYLMVIIY